MNNSIKNLSKKVLLVILDGYGINSNNLKNAVKDANTPVIDKIFKNFPFTTIEAGGELVGLPKGIAGNSEVGHMNIGAGTAVRQDLVRINESISNNSLPGLPEFKNLIENAQNSSKTVHLIGLLSDGGVHSHINHIKYLIKELNNFPDIKICFHALMDGRDTQKDSGIKYINDLMNSNLNFNFSSISGRSIGMDRDQRWEKIEHYYKTITGQGKITEQLPVDYINEEYKNNLFDEFITPALFNKNDSIKNDDCVFFVNFRPDRAIELTLSLTTKDFDKFQRDIIPNYFLCMTPYVQDIIDLPILFDKEPLTGGLSETLSRNQVKQYKIAETEKYAHITYFFNGGKKEAFPKESQVLIPSPKDVTTYDLKPEMSAYKVCNKLSEAIENDLADFYLVNFANSDMVGHTGNYEAAIKAVETLDDCVSKLQKICSEKDVTMIITADHGNSDEMQYNNGQCHTSHTKAQVPLCIVNQKLSNECELNGDSFALKDIAPTILNIMGFEIPERFTGKPIFK